MNPVQITSDDPRVLAAAAQRRDSYRDVEPGDVVCRMLLGLVPMVMPVVRVDDALIYCGMDDVDGFWTFDRDSGIEIDKDIPALVSFLTNVTKAGQVE